MDHDHSFFLLWLIHRYIKMVYLSSTLKRKRIMMIGEAIRSYRVRVEIFSFMRTCWSWHYGCRERRMSK